MNDDDDDARMRELEAWFEDRRIDLYFDERGEDDWMALAIRRGTRVGAAAGERGRTPIEAAENLKVMLEAESAGPAQVVEGVGGIKSEEAFGMPGVKQVSASATMPVESLQGVGASVSIPSEAMEAAGATVDLPAALRERLLHDADAFGWNILFTREPDGATCWYVFDLEGHLLQAGTADQWADALLESIVDLYPPSGEDWPKTP